MDHIEGHDVTSCLVCLVGEGRWWKVVFGRRNDGGLSETVRSVKEGLFVLPSGLSLRARAGILIPLSEMLKP